MTIVWTLVLIIWVFVYVLRGQLVIRAALGM